MQLEIAAKDDRREKTFRSIRSVLTNNANVLFAIRTGSTEGELLSFLSNTILPYSYSTLSHYHSFLVGIEGLVDENVTILLSNLSSNPEERENRFSFACERFAEIRLLQYFFRNGCLATQDEVQPCNDDEYLGENSYSSQ